MYTLRQIKELAHLLFNGRSYENDCHLSGEANQQQPQKQQNS